jgi:hypothetical protein
MPQFGLLLILVLLPLQMLSGGSTPRESMPEAVQTIMLAAPTTHFIMLGQAILFRGADLSGVWPEPRGARRDRRGLVRLHARPLPRHDRLHGLKRFLLAGKRDGHADEGDRK